ncbi:MAG: DUF1593 domain-containing protein [Planctomycetota bacterium]
MADMGNETDEEQQMIHMLMYANMFDLEGLIACSGKYLHSDVNDKFRSRVHPELFAQLINAYAQVVDNLKKHDDGWPSPESLFNIVRAGTSEYGLDAVGPGRSNGATELIEAAILKDDPRKLYIVANAGTNTLAQALIDLDETRSDEEMKVLCERIIVFENGAQDDCGAWIAANYPHIAWHRSNHQTYCYGGPDPVLAGPPWADFGKALGPYTWAPYARGSSDAQDEWAKEHIRENHGPLGALYPYRNRFIEGGGTIPWMGLAFHGLSHPEHLYWGGQSGRFSRTKEKNIRSRHPEIRESEKAYGDFYMFNSDSTTETWTDPVDGETFSGREVPVWRFRRSMFNNFRARMDWCVKEFDEANHNPVAAFGDDTTDNILHLNAKPGDEIPLDATASSDPDGDSLALTWWVYTEAGTYNQPIEIEESSAFATHLHVPDDAAGKEIHVILEMHDDSDIIPMYDFRRIILHVK